MPEKKGLKSLLLLSCRSPFLDDDKIYAPMANLYLKSYVNKYAPEVNVVLADDDYNIAYETIGTDGEQVREYIFDGSGHHILDDKTEALFEQFDAIGISVMTPQREEAYAILKSIKERWPEKIVIAGGPHVKHYLADMTKSNGQYNYNYDYFVPLDGEKPLVGILNGETDRFLHRYVRTAWKKLDGTFTRIIMDDIEDPRILVDVMSKKDIYEQPRPDRTSENAINVLRRYHYMLGDKKSTTMMTARGCPEQCAFCEDAMTPVKWGSLENIAAQLDDIKNLGYKGVYIFDDLFAIAMKEVKPICEELKKRDLVYRCNAQARYFTKWGEDFAKLLGDTGCYEIGFGAESGSQKILDNINKRTTVEMNYKTVDYAKKHGMIVKAFILLGLPGENWETLKETERFIATSGIDDFGAYLYMPFKGTQLRDAVDKGEDIGLYMLVPEVSGAYGIKGGETAYEIRTTDLSAEELKAFRNYLVDKYRPISSKARWDKFYDTHLASNVEYAELLNLKNKGDGEGEFYKTQGANTSYNK